MFGSYLQEQGVYLGGLVPPTVLLGIYSGRSPLLGLCVK